MVDLPPPVGPTRAMVSPALHLQVEVGQHRFVGLVVEVDVVELDVAVDACRGRCAAAVGDLGHGVDQREDALGRGDGLLHLGVDAGQVLDRPHHEGDVGDEAWMPPMVMPPTVAPAARRTSTTAPTAKALMICTTGRNSADSQAAR